jgi:hypothetical protein
MCRAANPREEGRAYRRAPLPSTRGSWAALLVCALLLTAFTKLDSIGQLRAVQGLASSWAVSSTWFTITALRNEPWDTATCRSKRQPSKLQRLFRAFYLSSQAQPPLARILLWFNLVLLVACCMLLRRVDGTTQLSYDWELISGVSCYVPACCPAPRQLIDWEAASAACPSLWESQSDSRSFSDLISQHLPAGSMTRCAPNDPTVLAAWCSSWRRYLSEALGATPFMLVLAVLAVSKFMHVIFLSFTPLKEKPVAWKNDPLFMARIGAVIPCHMSAEEVADTCVSLLRYLPPENIVVVDNANSPEPPDATERKVHTVDARIQYIYLDEGLKTLAIHTGVHRLPKSVQYILHVDDDTKLSEDMVFDETWFDDPRVSEVTWPIFTRRVNLLTSAVGFFFKLNSHLGQWHNITSGTSLWAAGIIGLVRRDVFEMVLEDHVFLPFGEDAFHGLLQLTNGYNIRRDTRSNVITFAPPVITNACMSRKSIRVQGYGAATLFKQRAQRWTVTRLRRVIWELALLVQYDGGSLWANFWFRFANFNVLISAAFFVYYAPLGLVRFAYDLAFSGLATELLIRLALIFAIGYTLAFASYATINFVLWRHRPDYVEPLSTVLIFPLVRGFIEACTIIGHALCVWYWIPFVPTAVWAYTKAHEDQQLTTKQLKLGEAACGAEML